MKMKKIFNLLAIINLVCFFTLDGFAQQSSLTTVKVARLDSFLQVLSQNTLFNGSVLVSEYGRIVYKKSAGYYNLEKKIPNSTKTPFNLASVSKPFTATAILQLVQKGKIRLDEQVGNYLPHFRFDVTVKNLLTHTSGLPRIEDVENDYARNNPNELVSNDKAYRDLMTRTDSLQFQPGERFQYNNTNYFLLSLIVEKLSGMSFDKYMVKEIFEPAGMKDTYIRNETKTNTPRYILPTMYSTNYQHVDSLDKAKFYTYFQLGGLTGANNVVSTLEDLFLFDKALNTGKLVDSTLLSEAFRPAVLNNGKKVNLRGVRTYGYGWNIMEEPVRDRVIFHDGHIVGLSTMILKNPARKLTIFYYDNTDSKALFSIVGNISRILNNEPLNTIPLQKSAVRVFGEVLVKQGLTVAKARLDEIRADSVHYYFDELEMNTLGYDLLSKDGAPSHKSLSLEVFKMNMDFFPTHPNVYDSYGDALLQNGQREEAVRMYNKVIELDPKHEEARKKLAKLQN